MLLALLSSRVRAPLMKVTPAQSLMAVCSLCCESVLRSSAPSKGLAVHGQITFRPEQPAAVLGRFCLAQDLHDSRI